MVDQNLLYGIKKTVHPCFKPGNYAYVEQKSRKRQGSLYHIPDQKTIDQYIAGKRKDFFGYACCHKAGLLFIGDRHDLVDPVMETFKKPLVHPV